MVSDVDMYQDLALYLKKSVFSYSLTFSKLLLLCPEALEDDSLFYPIALVNNTSSLHFSR
jgi:hypothetical protein